jgi:hypothetical protein
MDRGPGERGSKYEIFGGPGSKTLKKKKEKRVK